MPNRPTGLNSNIDISGETYHVQTEDYGAGNPVVVTLVYRGGAIVSSRRTNYSDLLGKPEMESWVRQLVEGQHRQVIEELKSGRLTE